MPAYAAPEIDHAAYARRCRRRSEAELLYIVADCRAALAAMPEGDKAGYYQDEIHYAHAELERRRRGGRRDMSHAARVHAALESEAASLAALIDE
jgi:hypothetical protein